MSLLPQRVPLAWRNLTHHKLRFAVALAGVTFAILLMFMELGFFMAMLDSTVAVIDRLNGELVIVSQAKYALAVKETFTRRRLQQAQTVPGVESTAPLYIETRRSLWNKLTSRDGPPAADEPHLRPIRVLAFDPDAPVLNLPEIRRYAEALKQPNAVLMDVSSRGFYGSSKPNPNTTRELAQQSVRIVGNFNLGTDFANSGNIIMSDRNYAQFFPSEVPSESPLAQVDIGVVRLAPHANRDKVQAALTRTLPDDVVVITREALAHEEREFWVRNTPMGFVFGLGLGMGFLIGAIICYQILSADIIDHLSEYATLKAIGYHNRYLSGVVLQEALLLSFVGFLPGMVLSELLYRVLASFTGLPLHMTLVRSVLVLGLTIVMCTLSGLIVIRKVKVADPAEVF